MQKIIDGKGWLIGFLRESSSEIKAFNHEGVFVGYYNKTTKRTFDKRGAIYSQTDSTVALIHANSTSKR
jgi:hypothetical protein